MILGRKSQENNMDKKYTQREKMIIQKKRRKKKRKRIFIIMCFILSCVSVILVVFKAPFFNINKIECEGGKVLDEKQIIKQSGVNKGQNIFSISMSDAEEKIAELAYVKEVNVKRNFPNTVKITVKECKPEAYIQSGGKYILIDTDGKILEISKKNDKYKLMTVKGVKIKSPKVGEYIENKKNERIKYCTQILGVMEKNKMTGKVKELDLAKLTGIKINYDNRVYANCGSYSNYDDFAYKINMLSHLINEEISEYEKVEVDLTMEKTIVRPYVPKNEKEKNKKENSEKENEAGTENKDTGEVSKEALEETPITDGTEENEDDQT